MPSLDSLGVRSIRFSILQCGTPHGLEKPRRLLWSHTTFELFCRNDKHSGKWSGRITVQMMVKQLIMENMLKYVWYVLIGQCRLAGQSSPLYVECVKGVDASSVEEWRTRHVTRHAQKNSHSKKLRGVCLEAAKSNQFTAMDPVHGYGHTFLGVSHVCLPLPGSRGRLARLTTSQKNSLVNSCGHDHPLVLKNDDPEVFETSTSRFH